MKLHLVRICGIWHCGVRGVPQTSPVGLGFTPEQAINNWKRYRQGRSL